MNHDHDHLESDERTLAGALDRDAAALRREPDAGFEARVLRAALHADAEPPNVVVRAPLWRSAPLRVAAGVALMLTVAAIAVVSLRGGSPPTGPGASVADARGDVLQEIDAWVALDESTFGRSSLASFRDDLDSAGGTISFDDLGRTALDADDWM